MKNADYRDVRAKGNGRATYQIYRRSDARS
jgi:hypothetical protein